MLCLLTSGAVSAAAVQAFVDCWSPTFVAMRLSCVSHAIIDDLTCVALCSLVVCVVLSRCVHGRDCVSRAAPPSPVAAAAAEEADAPPAMSNKFAMLLASVDTMVAKVEAKVRDPTPPPTPPKGLWQRQHVKPHHTAAQELKEMLGLQVKEFVSVGVSPTPKVCPACDAAASLHYPCAHQSGLCFDDLHHRR